MKTTNFTDQTGEETIEFTQQLVDRVLNIGFYTFPDE